MWSKLSFGTVIGALALLSAGCGGGPASARPSPADSAGTASPAATGGPAPVEPGSPAADELVLRWNRTGGFAGIGGPGTAPAFSLYRDGRILLGDKSQGALPVMEEYRLSAAGFRRVVAAAKAIGLDRPRTVERPEIADTFTLTITFVVDGKARQTKIVHPEGSKDRVVGFWRRLAPGSWPRGELARAVAPYQPAKLAVLPTEDTSGETAEEEWPLGSLADAEQTGGRRCVVYTGDDLKKAQLSAKKAEPGTTWRSEGKTYRLIFRPLLPDERDCAAATASP